MTARNLDRGVGSRLIHDGGNFRRIGACQPRDGRNREMQRIAARRRKSERQRTGIFLQPVDDVLRAANRGIVAHEVDLIFVEHLDDGRDEFKKETWDLFVR